VALERCLQMKATTSTAIGKDGTELSTNAILWRTAEAADKRGHKNGGILISHLHGRCRIYAAMYQAPAPLQASSLTRD
jgi:hypothetical protein